MVIREIQNETPNEILSHIIRMTEVKTTDNTKGWGECGIMLLVGMQNCHNYFGKQYGNIL